MNTLSSTLLAVLLLSPLTSADGLQPSRVPAGARWLAHLDMEAMKASNLYAVVHEESTKNGLNELDEGLAHIQMFIGLDPTTDFKSVTVYNAAKSEQSCVALLSGNEKIDVALDTLKTMETYHTTNVDSLVLHTWGDENEIWFAYLHRKEGSDERVVIASQDAAELVRGVAVLRGTGESLVNARQPALSARPASGSIFFAAAGESLFAAAGEGLNELGDIEPVSAVAKLARTIVLDVGEDRGALFAHVTLDTRKPEDALRIQQVLQGAVALVGLMGDEHHSEARERLQRLVEALRFTVSNTRVDADFRYDVKGLIETLKSLDELHDKNDASEKPAKSGNKHRGNKRHEKKVEVIK